MDSDKKIWDDFKKGQKEALSYIYHQNVQLLFRYGKKFSSDEDLIKDTIQDLFFDLIKARENLSSTDNISYYLISSFRHKLFLNLKKQNYPENNRTESVPGIQIIFSVEEEMIAKEELARKEKRISDALQQLSPKQREIIFYRYSCNLDYKHICEIMGLQYDSARKLVFRALKSLKEILASPGSIFLFIRTFSFRNSTLKNY